MKTQHKKFALGTIYFSLLARNTLHPVDVTEALCRHSNGDWGDCGPDDRHQNEFALKLGLRLFSRYRDQSGAKFWIITDPDRLATTVLVPDDYSGRGTVTRPVLRGDFKIYKEEE